MLPPRPHQSHPSPEPASPFARLWAVALTAAERLPYVPQIRIFWRDLQAERGWWPILLPVLIWVGWRTYWKERRRP